eukprot:m.225651 g.225651  ORF g.225651 m.225651 type:complete len:1165 (+) comp19210_c0_seq1:278-3772(+)
MSDPPVPIPARRPTDTFRGKKKPDSKKLIENIQRRSRVDNSFRVKPGDTAPLSAQNATKLSVEEVIEEERQPPPIARKPTLLSGNPTTPDPDGKKPPPQLPTRSTATQLSVQVPTGGNVASTPTNPESDVAGAEESVGDATLMSPTGPPPEGPPHPVVPPSDAPPPPLRPEKKVPTGIATSTVSDASPETTEGVSADHPRCPSRSKKPAPVAPKKKATPPPPPMRNGSVSTIPVKDTPPTPTSNSAGTEDAATDTAQSIPSAAADDNADATAAVAPPRCPSRSKKPVPVPPRTSQPTTESLATVSESLTADEGSAMTTGDVETLPIESDNHSLGAYIEAETVVPESGVDPYEGTYDDPTTGNAPVASENSKTTAAVAGASGESSTDTPPATVEEVDEDEGDISGYGQQGGPTIYAPPKKSFKKPSKAFVPEQDTPDCITNKPAYDDMRSVVSMIEDDYEKPEDGEGYDRFNEIEQNASAVAPPGGVKPRVPSPPADDGGAAGTAGTVEVNRDLKRKPPPPVPVEEPADNADYTGNSLSGDGMLIDGDDLYEEVDTNYRQKVLAGNPQAGPQNEDKPPAVVPFLGTVQTDAVYEAIEDLGVADDDDAAIQSAMAAQKSGGAVHSDATATADDAPPVQPPYNARSTESPASAATSPAPSENTDGETGDTVGGLSPKSFRKKKGKGPGIDKQKRASSSWFSTKKKRLGPMPQEYDDILCQVGDADEALMTVTAASTVQARITGDLEYSKDDVIEIVRMDDCPAGKWVGRLANGSRGFLRCADVTVDPVQVRSLMEKAMVKKQTTTSPAVGGVASEASRVRQGPNEGMVSIKRKPRPHDTAPAPPTQDTEFGLYHGPGEDPDGSSPATPTPALPARGAAPLPAAASHDVTEMYAEVDELPSSTAAAPSYETMTMVNSPNAPAVPGYEDVQHGAIAPAQPAYERMDSINAPQPAYERMDSINAPQPAYEPMDNANNPAVGAAPTQQPYEEMGTVNAPNPNAPNPPPAFQPGSGQNNTADDAKPVHPYEEMLPPTTNEAVATAARQRSALVDVKMMRPRPKSVEGGKAVDGKRPTPTPPIPAARPPSATPTTPAPDASAFPEIEEADGIYDNAKLRKGADDGGEPPELLLRNEVPDVSINPEYSFVTEDAEMEDVYGTMSHYGDAKPDGP